MFSTFVRSLLFMWLGFVALSGAAHSQPTASTNTDRGLIWKVEKDGRAHYVFGTVHGWKAQWLPLNPTIEKAFADATTLAVEVDVTKADMNAMAQRMLLPGSETLEQRVGKTLYERTRAETSKIGLPEAAVNKFKPWGISMMLAAVKLQQLGFVPESGLDVYLMNKARASGKRVVELESADKQLAVMDSLSPGLQVAFLEQTLDYMDKVGPWIEDLAAAWKRGDVTAMLGLAKKGYTKPEWQQEFDEKFLHQRDVEMTRRLDELFSTPGSHFAAVGSLHLLGPKSIVEQLKAKGYRIEQL
jgi:uncharacterized protein YbaP (TraB family)